MKHATVMIKPASSLCNMRCKYCFYADVSSLRQVKSFGIMDDAPAAAVIANIFADLQTGDSVTFSFQGGRTYPCRPGFLSKICRSCGPLCPPGQIHQHQAFR